MKLIVAALGGACLLLSACGGPPAEPAAEAPAADPAAAPAASAIPEAVNGWREYALREGVVSVQPGIWRTDVIDVPVPAGEGLEYKLTMKEGEGLVYNITYGTLEHPGMMEVEFHGHTEQVDGVGDLMFYSKGGGSPESGVFTAPWDGIHGWYLKNESGKDVTVRLELAGFYELEAPKP
jgi:hypothetical protein